jgi:hypothetical protein
MKSLVASLTILFFLLAEIPAFAQTQQRFWAKYEGGQPGIDKKHKGRISFDNEKRELVFLKGGKQRMFAIPYDSITIVTADEKARRRVKETIILGVTIIGLFALPILFSKKKLRYVMVEYSDPEKESAGAAVFQVKGKDKGGVLALLAQKANLERHSEDLFAREGIEVELSTEEGEARVVSSSPRAKGVLLLDSVPSEAEVYVDAEFVGNTPAKLQLSPGKHRIRVSQRGYQPWIREVKVVADSEVNLKAVLEESTRFH